MPPSIGETCIQHLTFMKWADETILTAVAGNAPDRITTLQHIYLAEQVWLQRVLGDQTARIDNLEVPAGITALRRDWLELHSDWLKWTESVTDWTTITPHRDNKGLEHRLPYWQIVLHVVNHGSYHRGQVSAMLRQSGIAEHGSDHLVPLSNSPVSR